MVWRLAVLVVKANMDRWFISDTHFGHANALKFTRYDGTPLRPGFSCVEEMDEHMIKCWNSVVKPQDTVYHLGDVVIKRSNLVTLSRLQGRKILIRGNHDIFRTEDFLPYFDEIHGVRVFSAEKFVCTHVPIHPDCIERWRLNVHGHLHANNIMKSPHHKDPRYFNVSVEQVNYTPVHMDVLIAKSKELE